MSALSKKSHEQALFLLILFIASWGGLRAEDFSAYGQRDRFFLIKVVDPAQMTQGKRGWVYYEGRERPAGEISILDVYGDECLCRCEFTPDPLQTISFVRMMAEPFMLDRIRFEPINGSERLFLSMPPVPFSRLPSADLNGIKRFLQKLAGLGGKRYLPEILNVDHIQRFRLERRFPDTPDMIVLGLQAERLGMIDLSSGRARHIPVSQVTILKMSNSICFYILLTKTDL